jgi:O-acetyl-ADP-ribose deacetylase (regulator of RNase III)
MIRLTQGNLLEAKVDAVVNTVNTVGVMGKGIALMFKECFPSNFDAYARACKNGDVGIGKMLVTTNREFFGPKWIINFPTKTNWRANSRLEWIQQGLEDLVRIIEEKDIRSIAVPPLGCGNGGLDWGEVKPVIVGALDRVDGLEAVIYEPTTEYQNVTKRKGSTS